LSRVAVIDTGTNSTRLLIADVSGGQLHEAVRETTITRLGEGIGAGDLLRPEARKRVDDCVAGYAATIGELAAERALIIGTSSLRRAADGEQFLSEVGSRFDFQHRLLDGEAEAEYSFAGATIGVDPALKVLVFDVGGGSTEVVTGKDGNLIGAVSLEAGCVRIREEFLFADPPAESEMARAESRIDALLESELDKEKFSGTGRAIAVAGTVTALAALDAGLEAYDRDVVHGWRLTRERVDEIVIQMARMTVSEREAIPVLEKGRADVIVAGGLIVRRLLLYLELEEFYVSELDILDGVALAMANGRL
jgi:exopolyphosphatase/guanosine-5'-triphosphate,3'-diphosphate pyrophosphatase